MSRIYYKKGANICNNIIVRGDKTKYSVEIVFQLLTGAYQMHEVALINNNERKGEGHVEGVQVVHSYMHCRHQVKTYGSFY
jgi:hypothetical protein